MRKPINILKYYLNKFSKNNTKLCAGSSENGFYKSIYLNSWFSIFGTGWKGLGEPPLLEDVGTDFEVSKHF